MIHQALPFLLRHGYLILFLWVLAEQIGLSVPSLPILLAAGALSAQGKFSAALSVSLACAGALIADNVWYQLGRIRGHGILRVLCRLTFEPDSCVRRTQGVFDRYGPGMLVFAKFVPGLGTVAVPLAGASRMSRWRFLLLDVCGTFVWAAVLIGAGDIFSRQLDQVAGFGMGLGAILGGVLIAALAAYVGWKVIRRRRFTRSLRMARITPEELKRAMDEGEDLMIIDLRQKSEVNADPEVIPGALHFDPKELMNLRGAGAPDREVILYCTCPNEASSAQMALLLQQQGVTHVRPLAEGLDGWRKRGYPVAAWTGTKAAAGVVAKQTAEA